MSSCSTPCQTSVLMCLSFVRYSGVNTRALDELFEKARARSSEFEDVISVSKEYDFARCLTTKCLVW